MVKQLHIIGRRLYLLIFDITMVLINGRYVSTINSGEGILYMSLDKFLINDQLSSINNQPLLYVCDTSKLNPQYK